MNEIINLNGLHFRLSHFEKIILNYLKKECWLWKFLIYWNNMIKNPENICLSLLNIHCDNDKFDVLYKFVNGDGLYILSRITKENDNAFDVTFPTIYHLIAHLIYLDFKNKQPIKVDLLFSIHLENIDFNQIVKNELWNT